MKITTTRFGEIDVKEDEIIHMVEPILGFPYSKRYVILNHKTGSPFKWLQSVDDAGLAFVIVDPRLFKPDYVVPLEKEDAEKLQIEDEADAEVYVFVVIPEDPKEMSANLKGPLVVNRKKRLAKQIVLIDDSYPLRYKLLKGA
ncbi:MAG: flagellar assembly protein FliW [Deferribacteres bacterium]|nr:flagellar assembly protein FliW [Deferribacteres bacterium]